MTLEDIPSLPRTRALFTTPHLRHHTAQAVLAGITNTPLSSNIPPSMPTLAAVTLPVVLLRMDHRIITMQIRCIHPLMLRPLVLRVTIEGVIVGVAFVVRPLQIGAAIVALASKALLGTLHSRRHRRRLALPLETMVFRQMKR